MRKIILLIFMVLTASSQAQLGGLLNKAEKAVKKESKNPSADRKANPSVLQQGGIATQGVTSPAHQKYMGKVVFSSAMIEGQGKENESAFIGKAIAGEAIYIRAYMDNSITNYLKKMGETTDNIHKYGTVKLKFYIDGKECGSEVAYQDRFTNDGRDTYTTFRGALMREKGGMDSMIGMGGFSEFYSGEQKKIIAEQPTVLTPGDHKFRVDVVPYMSNTKTEGPVVSTGEITLTAKKIVIDPNNPDVCMPKAGMVDKALEAKIIGAFKKNGKFGNNPAAVRIVSQKWEIGRHNVTGKIINRHIEVAVATSENGKCIYRTHDVFQDWDGTGYQENSTYLQNHSEDNEISCKCIGK